MIFGKQLCLCGLLLLVGTNGFAKDLDSTDQAAVRQAARILKAKDRDIGRLIPDFEFFDVAGKSHRLSDFSQDKGVVIAVTSTSCPLSKKYFPTLATLAGQYKGQGLRFILLNPIATDKPDAIAKVTRELKDNGLYVHDQEGTISSLLGVASTTDALLLDPSRTVRYQGAVDDQYGFGYSLDAPRTKHLISAMDEFLKGQTVFVAATEAPGCLLARQTADRSKTEITYHNRISRIIDTNCGECHRSGGVAPFSLATYADLVAHAKMIETVVNRGTMPPWFAAPKEGETSSPWINDRSLKDSDKADLLAWLKSEKPQGDVKDALLPGTHSSEWSIGKPDLVVRFPDPIQVQATGTMPYKHVVVETQLSSDKWVKALEVRPGAPEVVHHVLVFARVPNENPERREPNGDINYWGIYVPGNTMQIYPKGLARKLPKGSQIRFQIHYTPNGTATEDVTEAGFVFADEEPENEVKTASLINAWFEIPPGAANHRDSAKVKIPSDAVVLGFLPHMHLRGKACSYEAITPDGNRELLLDVPRYDFNWQLLYRYAEPRTFAAGTVLKFNAAFDNSDKNPANPDPTATVHWGTQTTDEMIVGYVEYYFPNANKNGQSTDVEQRRQRLEGNEEDMLFTALDSNDDGKLSMAEVQKIAEVPRFRQANPLMVAGIFKTLDKDQDDYLSPAEFQNMRDLFRKNADFHGPVSTDIFRLSCPD